ncbi:spondin-1-like isoform X4 [Bombyx mandarina]|uniref:Spondin-1-like isoform X1 n=1 Tax=Bombyx mandarina TaxID=7092 RepID=A0A6J2JL27_BOMMA|nr:spondin-1-like isoform X1 [Bombyx mandarina]XP_028030326.1 spondin-1-like isoform X2 [Bombyx mandarina]XP_028030329.1 spondin-1-like isoform X4 [Bombyx mandarina]
MKSIWRAFLLLHYLNFHKIMCFRCDRRPYGSTAPASPPDGRFHLNVLGVENHAYLPEQVYTAQITSTDGESKFTGFMISAEGDTRQDPKNPRRLISLFPGDIRPQKIETAKFSDRCLYSVEQATRTWKTSVEVFWQAPPTGHGCVTLRAVVVENDEQWFEDGAPLTQKICEDLRQPDDMSPLINYDCQICDEAKYEISFTGVWSRNTHPRLYPENVWVPRFSDLVGASHDVDYLMWIPGNLAGEGMRDLAEHANSSKLETEIREKIGDGVRTLIKGKGHGYRKMNNPTFAIFRADKKNHLVSVAVALHPSPDWFLGVTRFELCQEDNTWLRERELNLFPWDAGTDSGVSYESPNIETYPQDTISRVAMSSYDKKSPFYQTTMTEMHPFGKLHIKFIRSYHRECEDEEETTETTSPEGDLESTSTTETTTTEESEGPFEPKPPSRYQNPAIDSGGSGREDPIVFDQDSSEECPMSEWQAWSSCEGPCEHGHVKGYQWRVRYHLVDGIAVEKYDPYNQHTLNLEVPKYCKNHVEDFQRKECFEKCSEDYDEHEDEIKMERRIISEIMPGSSWGGSSRKNTKH